MQKSMGRRQSNVLTEVLECVRNSHGISINKGCMSCERKFYRKGGRRCGRTGKKVEARHICEHWELSAALKNAGLPRGGVVRLKGTAEIIIH